jgi:hypothetical protein
LDGEPGELQPARPKAPTITAPATIHFRTTSWLPFKGERVGVIAVVM